MNKLTVLLLILSWQVCGAQDFSLGSLFKEKKGKIKSFSSCQSGHFQYQADSALIGTKKYGFGIFCPQSAEYFFFRFGKKDEFFASYEKADFRLVFLIKADGSGGYYRLDDKGAIFLPGPQAGESTFSLATAEEIAVVKGKFKKLLDLL